MKETKPTYKEYEAEVWKIFSDLIDTDATESEKRKFFEDLEQKEVVEDAYKMSGKQFDKGEINRSIYLGDAAFSAAYCLYMMF